MATLARIAKACVNGLALCLVAPCGLTCWLERQFHPSSEAFFMFWGNLLALAPGHPGWYLRRSFYRMTLTSCAPGLTMHIGSLFSHRDASVGDGVTIGAFAMIGRARIGSGCLIGTRASVLSGAAQHTMGDDGKWGPAASSTQRETIIGRDCWIGEGAIIMADVADGSLVTAGAVVSAAVPPGVVVGGNPARFVRKLQPPTPADS